jgi:hypothetical protein
MRRAASGQGEEIYTMVDVAFLSFYSVELSLRMYVHGMYFFIGQNWAWNVFDSVLVAQSIFDISISVVLTSSGGAGANLLFLRQLRVLKVTKVLRTLRALRMFTELRLMIMCILQSLSTLFWCLVLIIFVQYFFSMLFVQGLSEHLTTNPGEVSDAKLDSIVSYFGSVQSSILSLWMAVTGGEDWAKYYEVIRSAGEWRAIIFVFYIAFFVITTMNIVTGTFVNKAFNIAKPDHEMLVASKRQSEQEYARTLAHLFHHADTDGSGTVSKAELIHLIDNENHAILEYMGLQCADADALFDMLTENKQDAEVNIETFVAGLLSISGPPKSIDVHLAEHRILSMLAEIHAALHVPSHRAFHMSRYTLGADTTT